MKKNRSLLWLAIVLVVPTVLVAGVSSAPPDLIQQELIPSAGYLKELELARRVVYRTGPGPVTPAPVDPNPGLRSGPFSAAGGDMSMGIGGAIVTPRGGAMYSPKQRADQAIDRLIRRLD